MTGSGPPAILLSTSPARLRCAVADYSYINRERLARFRMRIRCPQARAGARAKLVFRGPLVRQFRLRNGAGTVRIVVDKPRGDARPLGSLTTRPRNADCRTTRSRVRVGSHRLIATARVRCRRLPPGAKGVLAVGGLIAARGSAISEKPRRASAPAATAAGITAGCEAPTRITLGKETASWKDCHTGPFTLAPWQSQWVGHIGSTPQFQCESGWVRHFGALEHPLAWATIGNFRVDLVTDPGNAWAWSWRLGLVTNWQFSGDITFWWKYRCFRFGT